MEDGGNSKTDCSSEKEGGKPKLIALYESGYRIWQYQNNKISKSMTQLPVIDECLLSRYEYNPSLKNTILPN